MVYKLIRTGLLIWEDFLVLRREEEGVDPGRVVVFVFNCAFCFLGQYVEKEEDRKKNTGGKEESQGCFGRTTGQSSCI